MTGLTFEQRIQLRQARSALLLSSIDYAQIERAEAECAKAHHLAVDGRGKCPECGDSFAFTKASPHTKTYCTKACATKAGERRRDRPRTRYLVPCVECGVPRLVRQKASMEEMASRPCRKCADKARAKGGDRVVSEPKPYICRVCGQEWLSNYTRCIGTDGTHRPTTPARNRRWRHWRGDV